MPVCDGWSPITEKRPTRDVRWRKLYCCFLLPEKIPWISDVKPFLFSVRESKKKNSALGSWSHLNLLLHDEILYMRLGTLLATPVLVVHREWKRATAGKPLNSSSNFFVYMFLRSWKNIPAVAALVVTTTKLFSRCWNFGSVTFDV